MKLFRYYCEATDLYPKEGFLSRIGRLMKECRLNNLEEYYEELYYLIRDFDYNLKFPDNIKTLKRHKNKLPMTCWFTLHGIKEFENLIDKCHRYLKRKYNIEIKCINIDIPENSKTILYKDKHQVVLSI